MIKLNSSNRFSVGNIDARWSQCNYGRICFLRWFVQHSECAEIFNKINRHYYYELCAVDLSYIKFRSKCETHEMILSGFLIGIFFGLFCILVHFSIEISSTIHLWLYLLFDSAVRKKCNGICLIQFFFVSCSYLQLVYID